MTKKLSAIVILLLIFNVAYAQVGINTESPKATLDIAHSLTNGTTPEGIIAPRLTRAQIIYRDNQYTTDQTGTIVYITDLSGLTTTKTAKITQIGYYYYDGNLWQPFTSAVANVTANNGLTKTGDNIQLGGPLTNNTSINLNSSRLNITGAQPSQFSIETQLAITSGSPGENKVLTSDATGNATWGNGDALRKPIRVTAGSAAASYSGEIKKGINSGISLTLPANTQWLVYVGQVINFNRKLKTYSVGSQIYTEGIIVRLIWAEIPELGITDFETSDARPSFMAVGCHAGSSIFYLSGINVINNTSSSSKTYYLTTGPRFADNLNTIDSSDPLTFKALFSNHAENYVFAVPISR